MKCPICNEGVLIYKEKIEDGITCSKSCQEIPEEIQKMVIEIVVLQSNFKIESDKIKEKYLSELNKLIFVKDDLQLKLYERITEKSLEITSQGILKYV